MNEQIVSYLPPGSEHLSKTDYGTLKLDIGDLEINGQSSLNNYLIRIEWWGDGKEKSILKPRNCLNGPRENFSNSILYIIRFSY